MTPQVVQLGSVKFSNRTYRIDLVIDPTIANARHPCNMAADFLFRLTLHEHDKARYFSYFKSKFHNDTFLN
jgi:hypothetical protein